MKRTHNKLTYMMALIAASAASLAVSAGEDIEQSRDAAPNGLVEIINARGEIMINGWDENRIMVEGELDDLSEAFIFEVDGDKARIEVRLPKRDANWGDGSDLTIHVPESSRVNFEGVSSDVEANNIRGGVRARTASGDIEVSGIASQFNLKSVSGDVVVKDSSGQANVSSVSGDITLDSTSERLNLNSVSGDVDADLENIERLFATVVSGDIEVNGKPSGDCEFDISSVSGDISFDFVPPIDAHISVETGPGGDISNDLTDDEVVDRFPQMKVLNTQIGDGSGKIKIRTVSGDIELDNIE